MPVMPDWYGREYLPSGSKSGFCRSGTRFEALGMSSRGSSANQPRPMRRAASQLDGVMMSGPMLRFSARSAWYLANDS